MKPRLIKALAIFSLCLPGSLFANRLLTSGYETNNLAATEWSSIAADAPTVVTDFVHSGTYSMKPATGDVFTYAVRDFATAKTSGTVWVRFYFRRGSTFTGTPAIAHVRATSEQALTVTLLTDNKVRLTNVVTATNSDSTNSLTINTWYRIEIRHLIANTGGEMELRYYLGDSTTPAETLTILNQDTLPAAGDIGQVRLGKISGGGDFTGTVWFDDIAINDDAGSFQNSWPGPAKIYLLVPNADTSVAWTRNTGSVNAQNVDDVPGAPDDATTYNHSSTNTQEDRLGLTDLGAEVTSDADILLADLYARVSASTATDNSATVKLWDEGGSATAGPTITANGTTWRILNTAEHLVYNPGTKTKTNFDSFDAGYIRGATGAVEFRNTALWLNVEWIESAGGGADRRIVIVE